MRVVRCRSIPWRRVIALLGHVAGLVLTTEALVVEKKEKEKMPAGDPHGGMGGMDF